MSEKSAAGRGGDSNFSGVDTTSTNTDVRDSPGGRETGQRGGNMVPITNLARSDEAPPGWRTKTIPLTPDATTQPNRKGPRESGT